MTQEAGGLIRLGRAYRRLSQRQLGEATGIPPFRIFRLEHGLTRPRPGELAKIAEALDLPVLVEHLAGSARREP